MKKCSDTLTFVFVKDDDDLKKTDVDEKPPQELLIQQVLFFP